MKFATDYHYIDRKTKARYVFEKYHPILKGNILDVGADRRYLKEYLPDNSRYTGIDKAGNADLSVDLEKECIPFENDTFDCVLCLDVLEHLDNIHEVFDELCRVSRRYVIISLPNAWIKLLDSMLVTALPKTFLDVWKSLTNCEYEPGRCGGKYGLPPEKPEDRHKWFFNLQEAESFVRYRSIKNIMSIVQIDSENSESEKISVRSAKKLLSLYLRPVFKSDLYKNCLKYSTLWIVLEKTAETNGIVDDPGIR